MFGEWEGVVGMAGDGKMFLVRFMVKVEVRRFLVVGFRRH